MTLGLRNRPDAAAHEVELKLELAPEDARKLHRDRRFKAGGESRTQESVYYDTPKRALRRAGYSLRVRRTGESFVQTVKATGGCAGLFDRPEWEARIRGPEPDIKALNRTPIGDIPKLKRKFVPIMTARVDRTAWLLEHDNSQIEVVHDVGSLRAGDEETPLQELELELKNGAPSALFSLARSIARRVPLRIGVLSKGDRGFALAEGALGRVHKASAVDLHQSMNNRQAFSAIVHACIRHLRLNEPAILERRDAEALHQARTAVRRLRSALSLFSPMARDPSLGELREELRWFGGVLGDARNIDVFHKNYQAALSPPDLEKVQSARTHAYDRALIAIQSKRLSDLLLNLLAWLATGEWRDGRKASARIMGFSAKRLERLWGKVQSGGERLNRLDDAQLHSLRIDIKKLRYAVEFLGGLYPRKDARSFTAPLEALQDRLGELNDEATAHRIMAHLSLERSGGDADTDSSAEDRSNKLAVVAKHLSRLEAIGRFWAKPGR